MQWKWWKVVAVLCCCGRRYLYAQALLLGFFEPSWLGCYEWHKLPRWGSRFSVGDGG